MTTQTETVPAAASIRAAGSIVAPAYRINENDEAYVVTASVPGVAPADMETTLDGEKLVIDARRHGKIPAGWTPLHREITQGDYRLVLELDRRIDRNGVTARLVQGVLTLTLPKAAELKPRKIEIAG